MPVVQASQLPFRDDGDDRRGASKGEAGTFQHPGGGGVGDGDVGIEATQFPAAVGQFHQVRQCGAGQAASDGGGGNAVADFGSSADAVDIFQVAAADDGAIVLEQQAWMNGARRMASQVIPDVRGDAGQIVKVWRSGVDLGLEPVPVGEFEFQQSWGVGYCQSADLHDEIGIMPVGWQAKKNPAGRGFSLSETRISWTGCWTLACL